MEAGAVDTHCHLFLLDGEPGAAVESARRAGVQRLICVGIDPESSHRSVEMAESFRGVFATAGMHPHTATALDQQAGADIEELLSNPLVVGVGECGLDYFRMHSPVEEQQRVFRLHVRWSREVDKPLVVHVRDAWEDAVKILDEEQAERVVLHCFSGDAETAVACAERGWFMSFAGNVTYPKNEHLRRAASVAPPELLLVETDSPFLAPQPLRGSDNEPANAVAVIGEIARVRAAEPADILQLTTANALTAFPGMR
ncbi:MAG TPA: TatD family hydrolase [Actinomycetota bacterium]|nr:TatD family hydrolase [Actinomycetota bacterium]